MSIDPQTGYDDYEPPEPEPVRMCEVCGLELELVEGEWICPLLVDLELEFQ